MRIKILGSGCANCHTLERLAREAADELGLTPEITAVTDYPTIVGYGVMTTPALVVDEKVLMAGRVPSKAQVTELLTAASTGN